MTARSVEHSTLVFDRTYNALPARVFAAWSNKEALLRWGNPGEGWVGGIDHFDFRIGGSSLSWFGPKGGDRYVSETRYLDIVPDQRIVTADVMTNGDIRVFVGMLTVEFHADGNRCRMLMTEQGAFLDGHDLPANHQAGWNRMLDNIGTEVARGQAAA